MVLGALCPWMHVVVAVVLQRHLSLERLAIGRFGDMSIARRPPSSAGAFLLSISRDVHFARRTFRATYISRDVHFARRTFRATYISAPDHLPNQIVSPRPPAALRRATTQDHCPRADRWAAYSPPSTLIVRAAAASLLPAVGGRRLLLRPPRPRLCPRPRGARPTRRRRPRPRPARPPFLGHPRNSRLSISKTRPAASPS